MSKSLKMLFKIIVCCCIFATMGESYAQLVDFRNTKSALRSKKSGMKLREYTLNISSRNDKKIHVFFWTLTNGYIECYEEITDVGQKTPFKKVITKECIPDNKCRTQLDSCVFIFAPSNSDDVKTCFYRKVICHKKFIEFIKEKYYEEMLRAVRASEKSNVPKAGSPAMVNTAAW